MIPFEKSQCTHDLNSRRRGSAVKCVEEFVWSCLRFYGFSVTHALAFDNYFLLCYFTYVQMYIRGWSQHDLASSPDSDTISKEIYYHVVHFCRRLLSKIQPNPTRSIAELQAIAGNTHFSN